MRVVFSLIVLFLMACAGKDGAPGVPGNTGPQGPPGDSSGASEITPCSSKPGDNPETLLCVDGALFGVYVASNPHEVRLIQLVPGTYKTLDGRNCSFTVESGCEISNEH